MILISPSLLYGCGSSWKQSIPVGEIVFMEKPSEKHYEFGILNFQDNEYHSLSLKEKFSKPIWTIDGKYLLGLSGSVNAGAYWGYPAYWDIQQGRYKVCKEGLPFFTQIQSSGNPENPYEVILHNTSEIVLFDLARCEQIHTMVDYTDHVGTYELAGFSYAPTIQKLIYGLVIQNQDNKYNFEIWQLNLETQEQIYLSEGISPSWSQDGMRFAFVGTDGLYMFNLANNELTKLVDYHFLDPNTFNSWSFYPILHWSPDNHWIVYHRCSEPRDNPCEPSIYRINLQTKLDENVYSFGEYPSWRP